LEAIYASELVKKFGELRALDGLSIEIEKGDIFCLLGPNGAGKSTFIRIVTGLMKPTSGLVRVAGMDLTASLSKVRQKVSLVSEKVILYDNLSPVENLLFFASMGSKRRKEALRRIHELLERVDMLEWKDKPVRIFSTGMRQRINFVRALINEPEIIFMDEPTLGLDPHTTITIREMVGEINDSGTTVVLTTHMMREAEGIARNIGIMNRGRMLASGDLESLRKMIGGDLVRFKLSGESIGNLTDIEGYIADRQLDGYRLLEVKSSTSIEKVVFSLSSRGARLFDIEHVKPTLEEVFIELTGEEGCSDRPKN
jgi:ABC-2 type transport system ATP-binding protein